MEISTIAFGVTLGIIFYKILAKVFEWICILLLRMWHKNRFMKFLAILLGAVLLFIAVALVLAAMNGFE